MRSIGLIVNPVAGMGGSVGLKGTDGEMHAKALALGATPVSPQRTREFLSHLASASEISWLVAPGAMGAELAAESKLGSTVVGELDGRPGPADTRSIARQMLSAGAEAIAFAGGDGTARDLKDAIDLECPVIAIPSGVKVYSSVFASNPRAAAELLDAFVQGADVGEQEVLDIDEDAFRAGRVESRHYGYLLVPEVARLLQGGKHASGLEASTAAEKRELASTVIETMQDGTLYLLGSGTTIKAIADELGIGKTLLGIDAVLDRKLVGTDLNEQSILELLDRYPRAVMILTPLGGNGFLFGRGNKQLTPGIIERVGFDNIVVIANRQKLLELDCLRVDTGDAALDDALSGYIDVIVGEGHTKVMRVQ
ncbi:MAG: ATP-NAD kinase family protein [Woeseiaceae bacterium]|nr:ATP-NAD kinase family protein [Woeseiaceae bacterium]